MQISLGVAIHKLTSWRCAYCPGDETDDWTTYKGADNNSTTLRNIMNDPDRLTSAQQGSRPKDGEDNRQPADSAKPSPNPTLYDDPQHGPFGDQAHHAISGNEILKNESIENLITAQPGGVIEKDTGYSVNNCANGVYLPDFPRQYRSTRSNRAPQPWGPSFDDQEKYDIVARCMAATSMQTHIGSHDVEVLSQFHKSYPREGKRKLQSLNDMVMAQAGSCPVCDDGNGGQKDPLPPPFKINQWLDNISREIIAHITSHPRNWEYYISKYARDFHVQEHCRHGSWRRFLPW